MLSEWYPAHVADKNTFDIMNMTKYHETRLNTFV